MDKKEKLKESRLYRWMQSITTYTDRYYLDGIAGLIPGGIGDGLSALFALAHVYFAAFRLHSLPLTLAIMNNALRDVLLGLIPFYVGDIIDFFHRANTKNMQLIDGFLNNDQAVIQEVNRKALQSAVVLVLSLIAIALMAALLVWMAGKIGRWLLG